MDPPKIKRKLAEFGQIPRIGNESVDYRNKQQEIEVKHKNYNSLDVMDMGQRALRGFNKSNNDVFQERSFSFNTQNLIHSDRMSMENEQQISRVVKPILYELLKEGSVEQTPKNEANSKFFDLGAQLEDEDARIDQLRANAFQ